MKFVPAGTPGVLFDIWLTRVSDFKQFIDTTHFDAIHNRDVSKFNSFKTTGEDWQNPGFAQTPLDPITSVSWRDAEAFCHWLTQKEQAEGKIDAHHYYRLPTDAEWSAAAGTKLYPWGDDPPIPANAGNYARKGDGFPLSFFDGADGFKNTSPVGSFAANAFGLYDMGGNVWEWCEDFYHKELNDADARKTFPILNEDDGGHSYYVLRGASWRSIYGIRMRTSAREYLPPGSRFNYDGFRCVLVEGPQIKQH